MAATPFSTSKRRRPTVTMPSTRARSLNTHTRARKAPRPGRTKPRRKGHIDRGFRSRFERTRGPKPSTSTFDWIDARKTAYSRGSMLTFSKDGPTADKQMRAVIFYLTTFGYIDGDFDASEKSFVRDYV